MSVDIATLGIQVDSSPVISAKTALDDLTSSGTKTESATKKVSAAATELSNAHTKVAATANVVTGGLSGIINSAKSVGDALGVTANQMAELGHSGRAIFEMMADGQGVMRGLQVEAPRLIQVLGGDLAGALGKVAGFINPVTIGIAAVTAAVIAGAVVIHGYSSAMDEFDNVAKGLGRTSGQTAASLEAISEAAAKASNLTVSSARTSVAAFADAGVTSSAAIASLAGDVTGFAKLTGQEAPDALKELAAAMSDPAKGAAELQSQLHLFTGAQMEAITQADAMGDKMTAQGIIVKALTGYVHENGQELGLLSGFMHGIAVRASEVATWFGSVSASIVQATKDYSNWIILGGVDPTTAAAQRASAAAANAAVGVRNDRQTAGIAASASLNTSGLAEYNDLIAKRSVLQKALADTTGLTSEQVRQLSHDFTAVTDTINANASATGELEAGGVRLLSTQQRQHEMGVAQIALSSAHTNAQKAAAQATITRLTLGGQVLTQGEREQQITDASAKALDHYTAAHDGAAKAIATHLAQLQANLTGQDNLNTAILGGTGTELAANAAKTAATEIAGKKYSATQAELEQTLQLELAVSKYVGTVNTAIAADTMRYQILNTANMSLRAGTANYADATAQMAIDTVVTPMEDVLKTLTKGTGEYNALATAIRDVTTALEHQNAATGSNTLLKGIEAGNVSAAASKAAMAQVGANPLTAAVGKATDQANATIASMGSNAGTPAEQKAYVQSQIDSATAAEMLTSKQDAYNDSLTATKTRLQDIADSTKSMGDTLSDAFGKGGTAIAGVIEQFSGAKVKQQGYYDDLLAAQKRYSDGSDASNAALANANAHYASQTKNAQLDSYGSVISGLKGLFNEHSKTYRAMEAIERAYALVRLAIQIKDILFTGMLTTAKVAGAAASSAADIAQTGTAVATSATRASAYGIEAFAHTIASLPFPVNLVAGAAILAALVGVGVEIAGGGKSATASASSTSDDVKPFDYSDQNSSYSVNDPDQSYGSAANNNGGGYGVGNSNNAPAAAAAGGTSVFAPVYNINANGATAGTLDDIKNYVDQTAQQTFQDARQAAAQDRANAAQRQRLTQS